MSDRDGYDTPPVSVTGEKLPTRDEWEAKGFDWAYELRRRKWLTCPGCGRVRDWRDRLNRVYCSNACRQKAARRRAKAAG